MHGNLAPLLAGDGELAVIVYFVILPIALLFKIALSFSVAGQAEAKGYRYWDWFFASFFSSAFLSMAIMGSLPHKSHLPDTPKHLGELPSTVKGKKRPKLRYGPNAPKVCHACDTEVARDAVNCGSCGARQKWTDEELAAGKPTHVECGSCGHTNSAKWDYCSKCGAGLEVKAQPASE